MFDTIPNLGRNSIDHDAFYINRVPLTFSAIINIMFIVNMFAAGVGSIPTITEAMIVNFVSYICSGIAYDAFKALFLEGVGLMKIFIILFTSWLGCHGYVV